MAHILLVDDDDLVRLALSALLVDDGHAVTEAGNGHDAIAELNGTPVDLVITDVFMPEMDGIELIRHLRSANPDLKILAISGGSARNNPGYAMKLASELGADATLRKPVDNDDMLSEIQALMQDAA